MLEKLNRNKIILIATCCVLFIFTIRTFYYGAHIFNDNRRDFIRVQTILDALKRAKDLESDHEQRYQISAIVLHWKRLTRVQRLIRYYLSSELFKEIILWNNNPQVNLTINDVLQNNSASKAIRIINSRENLRDEAKYRACTEAQNLVCFYADDDWDVSQYAKTLIGSFRSDPYVLHTATNTITYYNNLLWTFMDSEINLHTGFSWIGCGSVFLREHAQRHLQLLTLNLNKQKELFAFGDVFFSMWLNDIPSQMIVDLHVQEQVTDEDGVSLSSVDDFYQLQYISAVLAIRKLEYSLRLDQSTQLVNFSRQQTRQFPYCVKSPSKQDDFIFFSNVLPVDIVNMPFDITKDAERATYRNIPNGPNYTHFISYNTLKAVDNDQLTCWRPRGSVEKGDFFAIDFLRIRTNIVFSILVGHSRYVQNSLSIRISFDGKWWISHGSISASIYSLNLKPNESFHQLLIDSRQFSLELQSFRYIAFNATVSLDEPFQICDVNVVKYFDAK